MRLARLTFFSILFLALIANRSAAQERGAESNYDFFYVYQTAEDGLHIGVIDPSVEPLNAEVTTLSVDPFWTFSTVAADAGHEWIAVNFRAGTGYVIRLVNLRTLESRHIFPESIMAHSNPPDAILGPWDEFVWSPDGRYLAWNIFVPGMDDRKTDTFIYSLSENRTTRLTDDPAWQTRLAWSPDSSQLAISTVTCPKECSASIDLYDPVTGNVNASMNLTPGVPGANSIGLAGTCYLLWSPDGRYLSFMANCDGSEYGAYKEIYLLEAQSGILRQITDFTFRQERVEPLYGVFARYTTVWVDAQTLLISAFHGLGVDRHTETLAYHVGTGLTGTVSEDYVLEWAVNPVTQALAFRNSQPGSDTDPYQRRGSGVGTTSFSGMTETNDLDAATTLPDGLDFMWSPDGRTLAYAIPDRRGRADYFVFVDAETGTTRQYDLPFAIDQYVSIDPIGWMNVR